MSEPPGSRPPPVPPGDDGIPVLTEVVQVDQEGTGAGEADPALARERILITRLLHTLRPWLRDRPGAALVHELQTVIRDVLGPPGRRPPDTRR